MDVLVVMSQGILSLAALCNMHLCILLKDEK